MRFTSLSSKAASSAEAPAEAPAAPSPIRLEHAALLAAGVLALVAVRRRQRLRTAGPRHRVPEPRPDLVDTERRLRAIDGSGQPVAEDRLVLSETIVVPDVP